MEGISLIMFKFAKKITKQNKHYYKTLMIFDSDLQFFCHRSFSLKGNMIATVLYSVYAIKLVCLFISRDQKHLLSVWISKGTLSFPSSGHVIMIGPGNTDMHIHVGIII